MDRKNTTVILVVVGLALLSFGYIYLKSTITPTQEEYTTDTPDWAERKAEPADNTQAITIVNAKHAFKNGTHTVVGEVNLPNPCSILEATAIVEGDGKTALIELVATQKTDEACPQVVTKARFKVSFTGDKDMKIIAQLNGNPVTLNLIEALPGEDIENAEIFIKG